MGMVDQKIQAYPLLHSSQVALHASKAQSHIMLALNAAKSSMTCLNTSKAFYHLMQIFFPFCWPRARHVTCKKKEVPTKLIIFCSLMKAHFPPSCDHPCVKMADCFRDRVIKQLLNSVKRASSICLECLSPLICSPVTYSNLLCT